MRKCTATLTALVLLFIWSCKKENTLAVHSTAVVNDATEAPPFHIGQKHAGGRIFYLDSTNAHGLIADTTDLPVAQWWTAASFKTGADDIALGTGEKNTRKIVEAQGNTSAYAAIECFNSTRGGKKDWFLPSADELDSMYVHQAKIGGFVSSSYWSSSEHGQYAAQYQDFSNGRMRFGSKTELHLNVRAIRSF